MTTQLARVLKTLEDRTGQSFEGEDFDSRLRIQKAVYLLQALQYRHLPPYRFSDYFHGPYSSNLSADYYSVPFKTAFPRAAVTQWDEQLAAVSGAVTRGNDFLEAAASLHSYARHNPGRPAAEILQHVKRSKPHLKNILEEGWEFLRQYHLLAGHTSTT